jgi:arsenate reductase
MITIYHNPGCGTSRTVLQLLQDRGLNVDVVEYLQTPWSRDELATLIRDAGLSVREAMRSKDPIYQELNLDDPRLSDGDLLDAMAAHPTLVNRPFVVTDRGTRLCRPASLVEEILPG